MKKLTSVAAILALSGMGFAANANGIDQGPEIETTPAVSERYDGRLNASVNMGRTPDVTPVKGDKAVAELNNSIDRS